MVGIYNVIVMIFYHYILIYIYTFIFLQITQHMDLRKYKKGAKHNFPKIYIYIYGDKVLDIPPTPRKLCPT